MALAMLTFVAVFVLIASAGLLWADHEKRPQIADVLMTPDQRRGLSGSLKQAGMSFGTLVEHLEGAIPRSQAEVSVMQQRMIRAGFRNDSAVKIFYGAKVVVMAVFLVLCLAHGA